MRPRVRPARPPSKLAPALMASAIAVAGFATLMVRLQITREGYRLSSLSADITHLEEQNRQLNLREAQLSSHDRLRSLAPKYGLVQPAPGQVVMMR